MRKTTKTTKRVTRKKNFSVKSSVQYVRSTSGELFKLANGKLAQGRDGWRSVRLSELRKNLGWYVAVTTKTENDNYNVVFLTSLKNNGHNGGMELHIGCKVFSGNDAVKILKRAQIAVSSSHIPSP
jgi:hypothetical protein